MSINDDMIDNIIVKREIFLETNVYQPKIGDCFEINSEDNGRSLNKTVNDTQRHLVFKGPLKQMAKKKLTRYDTNINQRVWRTRFLRIIYFVTKFLQKLKQNSERIKFKMITKKIFGIINDQASDYQFFIQKGLIRYQQKFCKKISHFFEKVFNNLPSTFLKFFPVLYPDSNFRMFFDTVLVLTIIINIFYIPVNIAFDVSELEYPFMNFILEDFPTWIFLIEILLNFNTAFYETGIIHTERRSIITHYLSKNFISDMIVVLPIIISRFNIQYVKFTLLLRTVRIKEKFDHFEEVFCLRDKFSTILDLVRLVYFVMFVSHFCACGWYYLATKEQNSGSSSWLSVHGLSDKDISAKYIQSLYFCTITITTVGYGDITPTNPTEMIFTIFMTLVTCGVFGYAINNIGQIFKDMEEKQVNYKTYMAKVNRHLKKYNINQNLSLQVRKYFEYYFQRIQENEDEVKGWFELLPNELQKQVKIEKYFEVLSRSKFFRENLSKETLEKLCLVVQEIQYSPDDIIFKRGELQNRLYFLESGDAKIVHLQTFPQAEGQDDTDTKYKTKETVLRRFQPGYVIGEKNFLLDKPMDYQASAQSHCVVYFIEYRDFVHALKQNIIDYERYCLIRDALMLNQQHSKITQVCEICSSNHSFRFCPFTFFLPNELKIITKDNLDKKAKRKPFKRPNFKRQVQDHQQMRKEALTASVENEILREDEITLEQVRRYGIRLPRETSFEIGFSDLGQIQNRSKNPDVRRHAIQIQRTESVGKKFIALIEREKDMTPLRTKILSQLDDLQMSQSSQSPNPSDSERLTISDSQTNYDTQQTQEFLKKNKDFNQEIKNFEKSQNYNYYNPQFNINNVLKKYEKLRLASQTFQNLNFSSIKNNQVAMMIDQIKSFRVIVENRSRK